MHSERDVVMPKTLQATCAFELPAGVADGASAPPTEILLVPAGDLPTQPHDPRAPFRNDNVEALVAATREIGHDLVIDYDHHSDLSIQNGAKAIAAGWIKDVFAREGALWGRVEWTSTARKHLSEREYRFISPTFLFDSATRNATRLLRAALTNDPALQQMKAIASTQGETMDEFLKAIAAALGLPEDSDVNAVTKKVEELKATAAAAESAAETSVTIAKALDLDDDAKPEDIVEAVTALATAATKKPKAGDDVPDPSKFVPMSEYTALSARVEAMESTTSEQAATAAVDGAIEAGKLIPANREWAMSYATKDLEGFQSFAAAQPVIVKGGQLVPGIKPTGNDGDLTDDEKAICKAQGLSVEEFKKTRDADSDAAAA